MATIYAAIGRILADVIARIVGDWRRDRALRDQGQQEVKDDAQDEAARRAAKARLAVDHVRRGGEYAGRVRRRFERD